MALTKPENRRFQRVSLSFSVSGKFLNIFFRLMGEFYDESHSGNRGTRINRPIRS